MEDKKVLFITFDMSGYYDGVYRELQSRYTQVDYFNTATFKYKYKNILQKTHAFFMKLATGKKLKNYYKCADFINKISNQEYDITIIIRPDVLFDSQLNVLRKVSKYNVAYYHDSINNIKRKKDVIAFFDKVYSYEKKDVSDYKLQFISNFIYFDADTVYDNPTQYDAFSVMSNDYRVATLKKVAEFLRANNHSYEFYVMKDGELPQENLVTYINKRMNNDEVIEHIKKARIITDIHKYGIQDGLTFRVFESMGFGKKLITTNTDVKNYDFYNPDNIFVIEDVKNINIPNAFFETPYAPMPHDIYNQYTVKTWVDKIIA
jgi:hypothetical protein